MRWVFVLLAALCLSIVKGQQPQAVSGLFATVKPDVTIVVKKHPTGADMVEITMLNAKYPPQLLKERILALGTALDCEPRGLAVGTYSLGAENDPNLTFVKGTFAIDGLVDMKNHRVRIQELLRSFVGDPEPLAVKGFSILFDSIKPDSSFVRSFVDEHVQAEARTQKFPIPGIEYRISVNTRNPQEVNFPDHAPERKAAIPPSQPEEKSPLTLWIAIAAAALAAGVLVYLALLRTGSKSSPRKR